jgi:hypothetical protein
MGEKQNVFKRNKLIKSRSILLLLFLLFLLKISGCAYRNTDFFLTNNYIVSGKRGTDIKIDVRDFIRPKETTGLLETLNLHEKSISEKVDIIFKYICGLKKSDEKLDYWQYPSETLERGGGDCEDKVFLLTSALIEAGLTNVYAVKGRYLGGGHFWVECDDLILDPSQRVSRMILKRKAFGYKAFFKFDSEKIFENRDL